MKHFIFDCDDVLLDWVGGFRDFLVGIGHAPAEPRPRDWSMAEWIGIEDAATLRLIEVFNSSPAFGQLKPYDDALEMVRQLKDEGHTLTVLTSCSDDPNIVDLRVKNLRDCFGDVFPRVICLPLGQSKSQWLEVLRPGIWIEDNYKNALIGQAAGHKTFILRRPHNRKHEIGAHRAFVVNPHEIGDDMVTWIDTLAEVL
ncbi:hypothetical protein [Mesorhizobium sp. B2-4-1]|uniref:hypothetical protein n=1 Tax=Mesorhizobium sp. B2-4-1 TaxID=2589948 RepID=UPI0015E2F126|nr:hypothetical protein [Mesorhizobium sp. B2-4-1]